MPERRRILQRAASLGEIDEILGAMKSLAFVEVRRIAGFIDAQRQALESIEAVAADFLAGDGARRSGPGPAAEIVCLLGAERGLCGDFNSRIAQAVGARAEALSHARAVVVVGSRLADQLGQRAPVVLAGASVVEEVPVVIARFVQWLAAALPSAPAALGLQLVYADGRGVQWRRLLPFAPPVAAAPHTDPLRLQLAPTDFLDALVEQYLYALLHAIFYESLLEENRTRLEHMQRARDQLGEHLGALNRRARKLRQEEITEEIELILLGANPPTDAASAGGAR